MELDNDDDLVDAALGAVTSLWFSVDTEAVLLFCRARHFLEKDGNRVPSLLAIPTKGESASLRFLSLGFEPTSPSLKNPSAKS